jgi:competence ComEA-like helix-hairpin-helix protein
MTMTMKVRINLANPLELLELRGIGPEQATAIVQFRAEHGPIQNAAELTRVLRGWRVSAADLERLDFDPADSTAPESPGA